MGYFALSVGTGSRPYNTKGLSVVKCLGPGKKLKLNFQGLGMCFGQINMGVSGDGEET